MSLSASLQKAYTKAFDTMRRLNYPDSPTIWLLRRDGKTQPFAVVARFDNGWTARFDSFRQQFLIELVADSDFENVLRQASHVSLNQKVYEIERGDSANLAAGLRPVVQIYVGKTTTETFDE